MTKRSAAELAAERRAQKAETKQTLDELAEEGEQTATLISEAFEIAGGHIADALEDAARSGELSFSAMLEAIAQDVASLFVGELLVEPLRAFAQSATQTLAGQRAEGGPVLAGERYLVGERGPEVFTPMSAGSIQSFGAGAPVTVVINAGADATEAVRRSERQIAAAVARAAIAGRSSL
ncbi:MAG: phage tail tape measure C-terminal domain-containing protein [Oceanicaulis sp.]